MFFSLFCIINLCSCIKPDKIQSTDTDRNLPDMVMTDATYTFGEKGRKPVVMQASRITVFSRETDKTELENILFNQDDEMTGSCDKATVTDNNNKAFLEGNIKLYKKSENYTIICDSLVWDNRSQIISTNGTVNVCYKDGTDIKAIGFTAKLNENVYEFGQILEGKYESEK